MYSAKFIIDIVANLGTQVNNVAPLRPLCFSRTQFTCNKSTLSNFGLISTNYGHVEEVEAW